MCPIFVIKFSGVSDLQGVKVPVFPLTLLVIVTTVVIGSDTISRRVDSLVL